MKKILTLICGLFFASVVYAQNITPTLYLESIKANKTFEEQGDEIYFGVTELSAKERGSHKTVPELPLYLHSKSFQKVKDLKLWTGKLMPGQSTEIIIGLVERDMPPWNTDDLIGTAKVKITNHNGKMLIKWDKDKAQDKSQKTYHLNEEGADYVIKLQIK